MLKQINYLKTLKYKFSLTLLASMIFSGVMMGQISGTVTDAVTAESLIGANILIEGTSTGTITDIDGNYTLNASAGDVLVFSYTGYTTQRITVGASNVIDVSLQQGVIADEVVVTGYQIQRKRDITGAVSVISSDDLNVVPAASLSQKLAGKASGVTISTSGQPGDGTAIRVRGFNSLLNNDPLIVIDGVQTKDSYLNSINPNDIESIQVLKDAASASIYGARSSNGVVVITTKKGKKGKTRVSYDGYVGVNNPVGKFDLVIDPAQYREFTQKAATASTGGAIPDIYAGSSFPEYYNGDPSQPYSYPDNLLMKPNTQGTDWWDEMFDPATVTEHNLRVSGGNDVSTFSISGNYFKQDGTIKHTFFERFSARANSSFKLGRFSFGENISLSHINQVGQNSGNQDEQNIVTNIIRTQSLVPVFDEGGNFAGPRAPGMGLGNNPVKKMDDDKDDVGTFNRVIGNVYAQVDLIEGLSLKTSFGFDNSTGFTQNASFPNFEAREPNQFTFNYSENWNTGFSWISTTTLNFERTFSDVHEFNGVIGYEAQEFKTRNIGGSIVDFFVFGLDSRYLNTALADPATRSVGSGGSVGSGYSYFGKVDYSYDDWLLLSGTVRRDGSSVFAFENRYGVFPAGSVGVRLSKFMSQDWVEDLKVRFSYGLNGNDAIRADNAFDLFGGGTASSFYDITGANNAIATGFALVARGNPEGKWEELEQLNFGIDASLYNGKIGIVLDIFSKETQDLLFTAADPGTGGSASPAAKNIASMKNTGFDAQLTFRDQVGSGIGLDMSMTLGHYKNEINKISDSQTQFFSNTGTRVGAITLNRVGNAIGSFYGYETDGIFGSQGEVDSHSDQAGKAVGRIRFVDQNGDGVINDDDRKVLGGYHPSVTAGYRLGLSKGNWDFSTFIFGSFGNEIFNFNKLFSDFYQFESNIRKEVAENHWSPQNPDSNIPAPDFGGRAFNGQPSDYYVEDASYIRFESIQLGYTFDDIAGTAGSSARLYLQGQNLFTISDYSGLDPAMSNFGRGDTVTGVDFGNYPSNKTLMVGLNVKF